MINNPQTFIFIGKSGSGKGTQAALIKEYLEKNDSRSAGAGLGRKVFNVETGAEFRKFINGATYSAELAKEVMVAGGRQPDFLAVNMWGKIFVDGLEENEHIITDGWPRSRLEAMVLDTAFKFYKRAKPFVVYLNVTHDSVVNRMLRRGRADDKEEVIAKRLQYFEDDVLPAVNYYRDNPDYNFLDINGEPSIEEIHENIISKVESLVN